MLLTILSLLMMACLGITATNPQYQKPTIADPIWDSTPSNQCGSSTFNYFGNKDNMVPVSDCNLLLAYWDQGRFTYLLSGWEDSTALEDHFAVVVGKGKCEFALKRLDGLNNTIMLGGQDTKDLITSAILSSRNAVTFETVEGQMNCNSDVANDGAINIEWTLRTPGSTN
ncbi:hypothetical protein Daus18300_008741 [Diaporthe australafricana]|uniref:Ecp2 effector protein-like domain-containing protein n=1 Tax=Diaporthe australafricana TaxID=127596 RepID=A0ABR3WGX7_9PEZI